MTTCYKNVCSYKTFSCTPKLSTHFLQSRARYHSLIGDMTFAGTALINENFAHKRVSLSPRRYCYCFALLCYCFASQNKAKQNNNNAYVRTYAQINSRVHDYIYVRSHEQKVKGDDSCKVCHMAVVNTSTRPLWKRAAGEDYLCRQNLSSHDISKARVDMSQLTASSREARKSEKVLTSVVLTNARNSELKQLVKGFTKNRQSTSYKRTPLPVPSLSGLSFPREGERIGDLSLNVERECLRGERQLSLKRSVKQSFPGRQRVNEIFKDNSKIPYFKKKVINLPSSKLTDQRVSKGIWKGFSNTFMRNGAKLRSIRLLRKALLVV